MMLYKPKGRQNWMSGWRGQSGKWVRISLQTSSKVRAEELGAMLSRLAADHQWETLWLLQTRTISLPAVESAFKAGDLPRLLTEAVNTNVEPLIAEWGRTQRSRSEARGPVLWGGRPH